jgi:hypothetical protein
MAKDYRQSSQNARDRSDRAGESSLRHSHDLAGMKEVARGAAESFKEAKKRQGKRVKVRKDAAARKAGS